jgi:hypothetical protein
MHWNFGQKKYGKNKYTYLDQRAPCLTCIPKLSHQLCRMRISWSLPGSILVDAVQHFQRTCLCLTFLTRALPKLCQPGLTFQLQRTVRGSKVKNVTYVTDTHKTLWVKLWLFVKILAAHLFTRIIFQQIYTAFIIVTTKWRGMTHTHTHTQLWNELRPKLVENSCRI